jgi:hypothetical protein
MAEGTISLDSGGLFRRTVTPARTTYSVAYRSVFIRPNSLLPPLEYHLYLPPRTVIIDLAYGPDTPPEIVVEAEDLCFLTGTGYEFRGKKLTLRCRNLVFIKGKDESGPATIDLSGVDPDPAPNGHPLTAEPGADASIDPKELEYDSYLWDFRRGTTFKEAATGVDGAEGTPGGRGARGGDLSISCSSVWFPDHKPTKPYLKLKSHGGKGQEGCKGNNGGRGGNGLKIELEAGKLKWGTFTEERIVGAMVYEVENMPGYGFEARVHADNFRSLYPLFAPASGGKPGHGGAGGPGGDGGSLKVAVRDEKLTKEVVEAAFTQDLAPGEDGPDGLSGVSGDSGVGGTFILQGDLPKSNIDRNICAQSLGSMGGPPTKSWLKDSEQFVLFGSNFHYWSIDFKSVPAAPPQTDPPGLVKDPRKEDPKKAPGKAQIEVISSLGESFTPSWVAMVIERLEFEYFIHFIDKFSSLTSPTSAQDAFQSSRTWLTALLVAQPHEPLWEPARSANMLLSRKVDVDHTDIFGHTIDAVPNARIGEISVSSMMEDFVYVEKIYKSAIASMDAVQQKRETLRTQLGSITDKLGSLDEAITKQKTELSNLEKEIVKDTSDELSHADKLRATVKDLEKKIEDEVGFKVEQIIAAVSTVTLFTDPFTSHMTAFGAITSIGAGAAKDFEQSVDSLTSATGVSVQKKYLYRRMDILTQDSTKDLKGSISKALDPKPGDNPDYLSQVVASASKFESMYEDYLLQIGAALVVKEAFKALIDVIQRKNRHISEYNSALLKLSKDFIMRGQEKLLKAALQKDASEMDDSDLQLSCMFFSRAYEAMGQNALRVLYNAARAYNCCILGPTSIFELLTDLQSFGDITAEKLKTATITYFKDKDIPLIGTKWQSYESVTTPETITLDDAGSVILMDALRNGRVSVNTTFELAQSHGWLKSWFDVRVVELHVFLHGAVVNLDKLNPAERKGVAARRIGMHISNPGICRYHDHEGKLFEFYLPKTRVPFRYDIEKDPAGNVKYKVETKKMSRNLFAFLVGEGTAMHEIPLQSPFGFWDIEVDDNVEMKDCTSMEMKFKLQYRSRKL